MKISEMKARKSPRFGDTDTKDTAGAPGVPEPKYKTKFGAAHWNGQFMTGSEDSFHLSEEVLGRYSDYVFEGAVVTVMGQEQRKAMGVRLANQWVPVKRGDFEGEPEIDGVVDAMKNAGLQLMCRSRHVHDQAIAMQKAQAAAPIQNMVVKHALGDLPNVSGAREGARNGTNFVKPASKG